VPSLSVLVLESFFFLFAEESKSTEEMSESRHCEADPLILNFSSVSNWSSTLTVMSDSKCCDVSCAASWSSSSLSPMKMTGGSLFCALWGLRDCVADPSPPAGSSLQKASSKGDAFLSLCWPRAASLGELLLMPASLPVAERTDWTTEGAAELRRVAGGISGASRLDGPVLGDTVKDGVDILL